MFVLLDINASALILSTDHRHQCICCDSQDRSTMSEANKQDTIRVEAQADGPSGLPAREIIDWDRDVAPFLSQKK